MTRTTPRRPPRTRPKPRPAAPVVEDLKDEDDAGGAERLQKLLAAAGLGSRRQCEELISTGRVEVDRKVVTQLGAKADLLRNEIRVDGIALPRPKLVHYLVNKPTGVVCTNSDPAGRPRVIDLLPDRGQRVFTVGRLDMYSEGLILLTNDGELANRLTHPRYGVQKTYIVEVAGRIEPEDLAKLSKGVHLAEGFAKVVGARVKSSHKLSSTLEIVLDEGRNREIRRLLARVGHKVQRLKRIALGPLRLGELPVGGIRPLTREERRELREAASGAAAAGKHKQRRPGRQERAVAGGSVALQSSPKPIERANTSGARADRPSGAAKPGASKTAAGKMRPANKTSRPEGSQRADRTARPDQPARPERTVRPERTTRPPRAAKPVQSFQPKPLDEAPRSRTVIGGMLAPDLIPAKVPQPVQPAKSASEVRPQGAARPQRPARPGKPRFGKPSAGKPAGAKPSGKPTTGKSGAGKSASGKPIIGRPGRGRTEFRPVGKTSGGKPKRRQG